MDYLHCFDMNRQKHGMRHFLWGTALWERCHMEGFERKDRAESGYTLVWNRKKQRKQKYRCGLGFLRQKIFDGSMKKRKPIVKKTSLVIGQRATFRQESAY